MSPVQILGFLALLVAMTVATQVDTDYLYVEDDPGDVEDLTPVEQIHQRWKRETIDPTWKLAPSDLLTKAKKLASGYKTLPPNLKRAVEDGDFSKVTEKDIEDVNVTLLEYIPPKVFEKVNLTILSEFIQKFMESNRPIALGRLVQAANDRLDANYLLGRIEKNGGIKDSNEEAANILLYSAMAKIAAKQGIADEDVNRLVREGFLEHVSKKQLLKVKNGNTAKSLLNGLSEKYKKPDRRIELDDKVLISELVRAGFGSPSTWNQDSLKNVEAQNINLLPGATLRLLKPTLLTVQSIKQLSEARFESHVQQKAVADIYLKTVEPPKNSDGIANKQVIENTARQMGKFSAYMCPTMTREWDIHATIIINSEKLNLPAPLHAVTGFYEDKLRTRGYRRLTDLKPVDFHSIPAPVIKFSPPEVIKIGIGQQISITQDALKEIGKSAAGIPGSKQSRSQHPYFTGVRAQLANYSVQTFGMVIPRGKKVDFSKLPSAYYGAVGLKELDRIPGNDIETAINNLKDNPDALDDVLKTFLLKKLKDNRGGDDVVIPTELIGYKQRRKGQQVRPEGLEGLPWDSEFRLAYGVAKRSVSSYELKKNPILLGTLTPSQFEGIDIEEVPTILNIVRKSREGPQAPTLKALFNRLVEYIRLKTNDQNSEAKKLIKHLTPAEISRLPGSVLVYFLDEKVMKKLSGPAKQEIMIAVGELSAKDYALIPRKTREFVVEQGLDVLEKNKPPGSDKNYTLVDIASIGRGVIDFQPENIKRLTNESLEVSLEMVYGNLEDGLKQRACLTPDQRKAWRDKIVSTYGLPGTWDPITVVTHCCALQLLPEDDLLKVNKEGIAACTCPSDLPPPSHLTNLRNSLEASCKHDLGKNSDSAKRVYDKIKSERALDIPDLETHIQQSGGHSQTGHGGHKHHEGRLLNCYALRLTRSAGAFDTKTIESLPAKDVNNCLYELGSEKLSSDNAHKLWQKLVTSWDNSIDKIPPETFRLANHVLSGITEADVSKLNFSDPDIVAAFGRSLGFSKNILKKLATHFEDALKYPLSRFYTRDLVAARNILCGYEKDKLATINVNNFREALPVLRTIDGSCEQSKLSALANLVILPAFFGDSAKWDAADVRGVGILLKGLSPAEMKKIPSEAFLGVTPTVAQSLSGDTLKELSPDQLRFIPRFSAQAMSSEQLSSLTAQGRTSLDSVITGPLTSQSVKLTTSTFSATILVFITTTTMIFTH